MKRISRKERREREVFPNEDLKDANVKLRIYLDFNANKFYVVLFCLFEVLFGTFALFVLANRPLFAATKQCKSTQKHPSTKLEIKLKQLLKFLQIYLFLLNYTLRQFLSDEDLYIFNALLPSVVPLYLGLADAVYVATAVDVGVDGLGGIAVDVATTVDCGVDVQAV